MTVAWSVASQLHPWYACRSLRDGGPLGRRPTTAGVELRLRDCIDDYHAMMHLRQLLSTNEECDPSRLNDAAVVERVAQLLESRLLCACSRTEIRKAIQGGGASAPTAPLPPAPPPLPPRPVRQRPAAVTKTWIQIEMVGEDDRPIAGVRYSVVLPDGSERSGYLNAQGRARVDDIEPGLALVSFPELDRDAWEPLS